MRTMLAITAVVIGASIACAGRTVTTAAGPAKPGSTGAQAAAPMTVQEYDGFEKKIGEIFLMLQMHLAANDGQMAAKDAEQMAIVFGDTEQFWTQHRKADAVKWAQQSAMLASQLAGAAAAGDLMKARQASDSMQGTCNQCHQTYRQADAAGGFALKGVAQ